MRGLIVLTAMMLATPAFAADGAVRVVEAPPAAELRVTPAVAKTEAKPSVTLTTVRRCADADPDSDKPRTCVSVSTKTTASSRLIRVDARSGD